MSDQSADIVAWVCTQYNPEVVLLGGSRAAGISRPTSDWDLFLCQNSYRERQRVAAQVRDAHVDIELIPWSSIADNTLCIYYGPVSCLRVLLDTTDKRGQTIVAATAHAYAVGPPALQASERQSRVCQLARLLEKIDAYQYEPLVACLHMSDMLRELIVCWFSLHDLWSVPFHQAVPYLRLHDPLFATLLMTIASGTTLVQRKEACDHAYQHLFASTPGNPL